MKGSSGVWGAARNHATAKDEFHRRKAVPLEETPVTRFRLYVVGDSPYSQRALANFLAIAKERLAGRYELEVVDVAEEPLRALNDGVIVPPLLVRLSPPIRRIVGDLSKTELVLLALGLETSE